MQQYLDLVTHVLTNGTRKRNRTGVDTISTFGYYYEHDLADGFPLLTTKEVSWKNIVIENLWFLSGQTDISFLHKHGVHFWDAWADSNGKVPMAYGNFWRNFPVHTSGYSDTNWRHHNDQIRWVVDELKRNPMSRRLVVTPWAPDVAQTSALPPCHCMFVLNAQYDQHLTGTLNLGDTVELRYFDGEYVITSLEDPLYAVGVRPQDNSKPPFLIDAVDILNGPVENKPRLNLHLTQRSCDVALGVPYNLAGYAFLLHLFARFASIQPGVFGHSLIDAHVYCAGTDGSNAEYDHVAGLNQQIGRAPNKLPQLDIDPSVSSLTDIEDILKADLSTEDILALFRLTSYDPHPPIRFKVAV